jgi:glutamine synthetase
VKIFSNESILKQIVDDKVEFINMQFSDMLGKAKIVTIPVSKFSEVLIHGLWFDGSSIEGFTRIFESDMLLKPDLGSYAVIPWHKTDSGNIARFICDVYNPDGTPYVSDPRYILRRVVEEAREMGFLYNTGPECEFFLFPKENGKIKTERNMAIEPHDKGNYFDQIMDLGFDVRRDMMYALASMGLDVEASHHEVAPGQHEIDFKYGLAIPTADRVLTLKSTLKTVAENHGLYATFMPKPISGINGSGMHVHQSLFSFEGENMFFDDSNKYKLSKTAYHFMAGQIHHARAMSAILNPIVNSYKRLVPGYEAATYICWAQTNRSALIRVPMHTVGKDKAVRFEIRNPDPAANPYLAFAVLLKAGLDGIKNKMEPPPPVEEDVFEFDAKDLKAHNIDTLPGSLIEAIEEFKKSDLISGVLGDDLKKKYIRAKTAEWDDYRTSVTDWEINNYLEVI